MVRQRVRGAVTNDTCSHVVAEEEGGSGKFGTNLWATGHDVFYNECTGAWPEI